MKDPCPYCNVDREYNPWHSDEKCMRERIKELEAERDRLLTHELNERIKKLCG